MPCFISLNDELAEGDRYREAYHNVLEEVGMLVERNALAEEEAQRLSHFNAEILSHNNPAQRIMYVDRIRKELHETKQVSPRAIFILFGLNHLLVLSSNYCYTLAIEMLS